MKKPHIDYEMTGLLDKHREAILWEHHEGSSEDSIAQDLELEHGLAQHIAEDLVESVLAGL